METSLRHDLAEARCKQYQIVVRLKDYCTLSGLPDPLNYLHVDPKSPIPTSDSVQQGECLVKNLYLSMDPTMRGWLTPAKGSYLPPVKIGAVMRGGSIGKVIFSRSSKIKAGDYVNCATPDAIGWAQYGIAKDELLVPIRMRQGIPVRAWAGVLGGTGLTAYFGLIDLGRPKKGDTVVVSAAAGAVGSVVSQLAKNVYGCKVIGIAGGPKKCVWLKEELGIDAAVDYQSPSFASDLKQAIGPRGADIVFDNVGGVVLDAMLRHLAFKARVVLCGAVSAMNAGPTPIQNIMSLIVKSASMTGFTLFNYADRYQEAYDAIAEYIRQGKLMYHEDVVKGLENAPLAMLRLFGKDGGNFGKLVVDLHPPETTSSQTSSHL